jgi:hypothetical protein
MSSTVFTDYITVIPASWLNDVNNVVYNALGMGSFILIPNPPSSMQPYYTSNGVTQITTVNAVNNWILNVGYSSGVSLNSQLAIGTLIEINFYVTNGATPFFQTAFQIDGVSVTPQWDGGSAPTSGDANSVDLYAYKILKTGNAVYSVFGSVKQFQ